MTELEKLTKEKTETEGKIKNIEAEVSEINKAIWTKKAIIRSHQKHLSVIDSAITHLNADPQ